MVSSCLTAEGATYGDSDQQASGREFLSVRNPVGNIFGHCFVALICPYADGTPEEPNKCEQPQPVTKHGEETAKILWRQYRRGCVQHDQFRDAL